MGSLTATEVTSRSRIGDRFMSTWRFTAGSADQAADYLTTNWMMIDAIVSVVPIGSDPPVSRLAVAATGTVTFPAANPTDTETITINGVVYTINTVVATTGAYSVLLSNTENTQAANFLAAINRTGVPGTAYSLYVPENPDVVASGAANIITLTARVRGTGGNAITLAVAGGSTTVSGATLTGGIDAKAGINIRKNAKGTGVTEGVDPGFIGVEVTEASGVYELTAIGRA